MIFSILEIPSINIKEKILIIDGNGWTIFIIDGYFDYTNIN